MTESRSGSREGKPDGTSQMRAMYMALRTVVPFWGWRANARQSVVCWLLAALLFRPCSEAA